jgi:hypothetical protein
LTPGVENLAKELQDSEVEGAEAMSVIDQLQESYAGLEEQVKIRTKENKELQEKQGSQDVPVKDSQEKAKHDDFQIVNRGSRNNCIQRRRRGGSY